MFIREDNSYEIDNNAIANILKDEASPICRIVHLIPENSKVLDIGAGNGVLAKLFKVANKKIIIDGVEPNSHAAEIAKSDYRKFYNGYVQEFMSDIVEEEYDYIVFADVIEHIANPVDVFKDFFEQLSSKSKIVISTPNIAFASIRLALFKGRFDYVDSGILEKTHLRFYTIETFTKLIGSFSFNIEKLYFLNRNFNNMEINIRKLKFNPFLLYLVNRDKLAHVYQFLVVLTKQKTETETKSYGKKIRFPLLEYYLKPLIIYNKKIKNFIKIFY